MSICRQSGGSDSANFSSRTSYTGQSLASAGEELSGSGEFPGSGLLLQAELIARMRAGNRILAGHLGLVMTKGLTGGVPPRPHSTWHGGIERIIAAAGKQCNRVEITIATSSAILRSTPGPRGLSHPNPASRQEWKGETAH